MASQRILIVGTGAIGAFFASRISTIPNVKVSAICRSNYNAIKTKGIRVTSPIFKDHTFHPEYTFANPEEARIVKKEKNLSWDYLLVSTKVLPELGDPSELLEEGKLVDEKTSIVVCQNGLGIEEPYRKRFGGNPIVSMVTRASVTQITPGHILHKHWTKTTLGPYHPNTITTTTRSSSSSFSSNSTPSTVTPSTEATTRTQTLATLLHQAGIPDIDILTHTDMQFARWHKTAINAALNPASVLAGGLTNQALALDEALLQHQIGIMKEILHAATKVLGRELPDVLPKIEDVVQGLKEDGSGSKSSMLNDWEEGRKVEVEAILGNPLRQAAEVGVELPRTQTLYALLRMAQEMKDRNRLN